MPNANEMRREMEKEYEKMLAITRDLRIGKSDKEAALREVRRLGKELGYNTKPYNGYYDD